MDEGRLPKEVEEGMLGGYDCCWSGKHVVGIDGVRGRQERQAEEGGDEESRLEAADELVAAELKSSVYGLEQSSRREQRRGR
jgi:hypothetical protein